MKDASALYPDHVAERLSTAARALSETGFSRLVVHSGVPFTYFADDNDAPFRSTPHFAHWAPVEGPFHLLDVVPEKRPRIVRVTPRDFWYAPPAPAPDFVRAAFDVVDVETPGEAWKDVASRPVTPQTAFVGPVEEIAKTRGFAAAALNPKGLVARLDWERSYKTPYEVATLSEATAKAAAGYRAAEAAFRSAPPEIQIPPPFVAAVGDPDDPLPYTTIVALDERASTLHYHGKRGREAAPGAVFLIDAGAQVRMYGSDITRTYVTKKAHPVFARLLDGMKALQKALADGAKPGRSYVELHREAHRRIGALLVETGVLKVTLDEALEKKLTLPFFPHGLGHFLGIQVHDVAGRQASREGAVAAPPDDYPSLRTTRTIETRMVFTIEPGLYFIPMLLEPYRAGRTTDAFDWALIDRLTPCGGIRVEDDVHVEADRVRNLTREFLPE
ncbi:MAG TPA: Xaa-Pro dipeptidase [Thermoanaerobaculia bacterium]|nr:Xaa-Pro dipeptidase [Thermoanaerobaculia bacterium]